MMTEKYVNSLAYLGCHQLRKKYNSKNIRINGKDGLSILKNNQ